MALVLVLGRLCAPSSQLHLAEHLYEGSALPDLLGVPVAKVNDDRLYRALDQLLPHKAMRGHARRCLRIHVPRTPRAPTATCARMVMLGADDTQR
jgi:hypothetical protein